MTRAELLARIKKCLALAASADEYEGAAALAKARALMDEHGVDQVEIATADVGEARAKGGGAWTPSRWENLLATSVKRAIPVELIAVGDEGWAFVGLTPAPEIAAYAFTTLFRQLKRARADYRATKLTRVRIASRKTARADAFAEGWALAVWRAVAAIYPAREPDELVRGWLERRYPSTVPLSPRDSKAGARGENDRLRGHAAGRDVQLHQGVGASAAPLKIGSR